MGGLTRSVWVTLIVCAVASMAVWTAQADVLLKHADSYLTGSPELGTIHVAAEVWDVGHVSGRYYYEYVVDYTPTGYYMTKLTVNNLLRLRYDGAGNDNAGVIPPPTYFSNPAFSGTTSAVWNRVTGTYLYGSQTIKFWYYSDYTYRTDVFVSVTTNGLKSVTANDTLGMSPEPTALAGLGLGVLGAASAFFRRRRRS